MEYNFLRRINRQIYLGLDILSQPLPTGTSHPARSLDRPQTSSITSMEDELTES